jgi:hypothetical protein
VLRAPSHQGMARPRVADGGELTKGGPSASGVGRGAKTPRCKIKFVAKCHNVPRNWTQSLDKR